MEDMFCYQCEQAAQGTGCSKIGVCGKEPDVAKLQDLLVYAAKGISMYANRARKLGAQDKEVDVFVVEALGPDPEQDVQRRLGVLRKLFRQIPGVVSGCELHIFAFGSAVFLDPLLRFVA